MTKQGLLQDRDAAVLPSKKKGEEDMEWGTWQGAPASRAAFPAGEAASDSARDLADGMQRVVTGTLDRRSRKPLETYSWGGPAYREQEPGGTDMRQRHAQCPDPGAGPSVVCLGNVRRLGGRGEGQMGAEVSSSPASWDFMLIAGGASEGFEQGNCII